MDFLFLSIKLISGSRSKYSVHDLGQARISGQMVSVWFLSSSILLAVLQSLPASPVTTQVSACVVGEDGCCVFVLSFLLWASMHLLMTFVWRRGNDFRLVGCALCNSTAFRNGAFFF